MDLISSLQEEGEATDLEEKDTDYSKTDFSGGIIRDSSFYSVSFASSVFTDSVITDTVFDSCDFSNADFSAASFLRVRFLHCKLTGAVFFSSRLRKVEAESISARYISFDRATLEDVRIDNSDLHDSSFTAVSHKKLSIVASDLSRSDFRHTPLSGIALTSSSLSGIALSDNAKELKGAELDVSQALDIVRGMGVEVK